MLVSGWADKYRYLSRESSSEPGKWRTSRAPFQKGPMDAIMDPRYHTVVIKAATQMIKTEVILNIIGRFIALDPCPMLVVQPTLELGKTFSKDRLAPMIRDTSVLSELMPNAGKSHEADSTILYKRFPGGHITIAGANSAPSLAMRPVRFLFLDEVNRYPLSVGMEGSPIELAMKRTATFFNRKHIITSSPTVKGNSVITAYFLQSNQNYFYVPCPDCKKFWTLIWKHLKWDTLKLRDGKKKITDVRYECLHCSFPIEEAHKPLMLKKGRWKAKYKDLDNGICGFSINELYSPFKTWKELAQTFLDSKDDIEKLQVFVNTSINEDFEERGEAPEWELLYKREKSYSKGRVPNDGLVLVAGADVQTDRLEVEIKAYGKNKKSYSIDYRVFHGDPEGFAVWENLDNLLDESFEHESGGSLQISLLAIDSGYATNDVYTFGRRWGPSRVMVIKGTASINEYVGKPSVRDFDHKGKIIKRGVRLYPINVTKIKTQIFGYLRSEEGQAGFMAFPAGYPEEYYKQLTAETLLKRKDKNGFYRYEYKKIRERNEVLDCNVYARAASVKLGIDYFTDIQWEYLREQVSGNKKAGGIGTSPTTRPKKRLGMVSRGVEG